MSKPANLETLENAMQAIGFALVRAESGTMDSGRAEFSNGDRSVVVWKDRSQWTLDGSREDREPFGLWRAFDDTREFCDALVAYLSRTEH